MATHSKNIRANHRAALLVTETALSVNTILAAGRINLMSTIQAVKAEQVEPSEISN